MSPWDKSTRIARPPLSSGRKDEAHSHHQEINVTLHEKRMVPSCLGHNQSLQTLWRGDSETVS